MDSTRENEAWLPTGLRSIEVAPIVMIRQGRLHWALFQLNSPVSSDMCFGLGSQRLFSRCTEEDSI